ncbi:MAG: argininosuccinate lyase [Verrucomicrobia bacterium]|nr:argininosuccinate lyase [Verrucomicrobiota bacterium]
MAKKKTITGHVSEDVLEFTAGKDVQLDRSLIEADCIGTAAHATMLSKISGQKILTPQERDLIVRELIGIIGKARRGAFTIQSADQDVHMAVERVLTSKLGDTGKRIHAARSRNDQVAVDLRLFGKEQLLTIMEGVLELARALTRFGKKHAGVPMVGRTHLQPAMLSSVGIWASAHAESLIEDMTIVAAAYEVNNKSPLGSAAGYGVTLNVDRNLTASLMGFEQPHLNVLYASNARGKCESVVLAALAQVMITLSRLSEDLILYSTPEFGYFSFPPEFCTGSSIMPQKQNPDVLELTRARARKVSAHAALIASIVQSLPSGYSRDLQETKEPYIEGVSLTAACVGILCPLIEATSVHPDKLLAGFTPDVFAADVALDRVVGGQPFRDAYDHVKTNLADLGAIDPVEALAAKMAAGSASVDFAEFTGLIRDWLQALRQERRRFHGTIGKLLGVKYPELA